MPVPGSIDDLSETPSSNSPQGSEPVGPQANDYLQTAFSFIKKLANGNGLKPSGPVAFNGQKATGLAAGTLSPTSTDAVNGSQLYKVGEVRMWHGAVANIAAAWGAGWQICDGTNGTADLRDRFIVGAGSTYAANATGGAATVALSVANLPAHNHDVNDPKHSHTYVDNGHAHTTFEQPHFHGGGNGRGFVNLSAGGGQFNVSPGGGYEQVAITATASTGLQVQASGTGIAISAAATGISTQNTGGGTAIENRPPYYALCFVEYTGLGTS